jgi:hypothetical protein
MAGPNIYDQIINGSFDAIGMQPQQLPRRSGGGFLELLTDAEGLDGLPRRSANPVNQLGYAPVSGSVGRVFNSPGNYAPEDFAYSVQRAKEMTAPAERPAQWDRSLRALADATYRGYMAPYNAMTGKYDQFVIDPETGKVLSMIDPRLMDDAAAMAGLVTTSGMPMPKPAGALGIFGGKMAATADKAALAKAEQMAAAGASRDEIWNATGWFKGKDDKWRFEIDDSRSAINTNAAGFGPESQKGPLARALQHDPLYDAYPELAGLPTSLRMRPGGLEGFYAPPRTVGNRLIEGIGVEADTKAGLRSGVLHEAQHGVETREGFTQGGSPDDFGVPQEEVWAAAKSAYEDGADIDTDVLLAELLGEPRPAPKAPAKPWDELTQRQKLEWFQAGRERIYRNLAGEVEARNVQYRADLTPEQRRAKAPWLTQDVPDDLQIVRFRP